MTLCRLFACAMPIDLSGATIQDAPCLCKFEKFFVWLFAFEPAVPNILQQLEFKVRVVVAYVQKHVPSQVCRRPPALRNIPNRNLEFRRAGSPAETQVSY